MPPSNRVPDISRVGKAGRSEMLACDPLVGTVSIHGSHLHASVSDSVGQTTGGHLLDDNLVYTTAEIVIGESRDHPFTREKDGTTEWPELQVLKKK